MRFFFFFTNSIFLSIIFFPSPSIFVLPTWKMLEVVCILVGYRLASPPCLKNTWSSLLHIFVASVKYFEADWIFYSCNKDTVIQWCFQWYLHIKSFCSCTDTWTATDIRCCWGAWCIQVQKKWNLCFWIWRYQLLLNTE